MACGERGTRADTEVGTIAIAAGGVRWAVAVGVRGGTGAAAAAGTVVIWGAGGPGAGAVSGAGCDLTAAADWAGGEILVRDWTGGDFGLGV